MTKPVDRPSSHVGSMLRILSKGCLLAMTASVLPACPKPSSDHAAPSSADHASLAEGIAARVGDIVIPVSLVATVASTEGISPVAARARLVDDAIAAHAARQRGLAQDRNAAAWALVSARAGFTTRVLLAAAKAKGPPTDEEISELSKEHWREVDRPPSVRVIHALVKRPQNPNGEVTARAVALAANIRRAVEHASDADDFKTRAEAVPHDPDLSIVVESLPPFIATGELLESPGGMVEPFAKAAHAIADVSGTSPVVETTFGWHVIRLIERLPDRRMPFESRRLAFAEVTYARRARADLDARLEALRKQNAVSIVPAAEQLMLPLTAARVGAP